MPVERKHIYVGRCATIAYDDVTTEIGGAGDFSVKPSFARLLSADELEGVSENAGDTTQTITLTCREDPGGDVNSEVIELNGQTPVAGTLTANRVLKAVKSATCAGNVALLCTTPVHSGTAQAGGADSITLAAGASGTDDAYRPHIIRITSGTGVGQIRECMSYNGTTKVLKVRDWTTAPDATSVYEICEGMFFDKLAMSSEVMEVSRVCYLAEVPDEFESDVYIYDKFFIGNGHATRSLTNSKVSEVAAGLSALFDFALETSIDGSGTNGAGNNRNVAPSSGVGSFDSTEKDVPNSGNLPAGSAIGVWVKFFLEAGTSDVNDVSRYQIRGSSIT